jgi:transcriptional regulator of nitric oxide reductase
MVVMLSVWRAAVAEPGDGAGAAFTAADLAAVFPGGEKVGAPEGQPPAAPVHAGDRLVGYLFSTLAVAATAGYSGRPLDVVAGVNLAGVITGARLRAHQEPILVIGISDADLAAYVGGFAGTELRTRLRSADGRTVPLPDAISGATVSSAVIRDGIIRAGRAVADARGLLAAPSAGPQPVARLDRDTGGSASWAELIADGSIVRRRITEAEVDRALGRAAPGEEGAEARTFIELFLALATPARIGENLLGRAPYTRLASAIGIDDQILVIAANGRYSFKGTGYVRSGRFERMQIVQGARSIALIKDRHETIEALQADGAPEFREIGVFTLPATDGLDPLAPWRLDLVVGREVVDGRRLEAVLPIAYELPARYRLAAPAPAATAATPAEPAAGAVGSPGAAALWRDIWAERWGRIAALVALLTAVSLLFILQDLVARHRRAYRRARLAVLALVLVWLGWWVGGQLSVVNVLTFSQALMTEFRWEFFLLDPVIFILWGYVAVALLFLGRGVFCGWLCPFGALQELLAEAARAARLPQLRLPFVAHEKLWGLKYVLFLGLFAVSLNSMGLAFTLAEVEPFKTAILLHFQRAWPFVVYAVALLAAGLFVERLFCRYLCPLGAALAIPARLRMFEWLKRRPQCGRECGICAQRCPVQAIHPSGAINPNECIYCLGCQLEYFDDTVCPPLAAQRKRRERREALASGQAIEMPGAG